MVKYFTSTKKGNLLLQENHTNQMLQHILDIQQHQLDRNQNGGTIAVDPKVIPYGTKVYIPYFNKTFIANDCGGAIKGTKIDIFMNSRKECYKFGRRNIEIIVLNDIK